VKVARLGLALMKGVRHEELTTVDLTPEGPRGDRELCLVDLDRRRVVRTVEHPAVMRARVRAAGEDLVVTLPDREVAGVAAPTGALVECDYWGRRPALALLAGPHAAAFSSLLGREVALARARPGDVVFGAPLTVVTTTDLVELGRRAGVPAVDPARFRATVVLDDAEEPVPPDHRGRLRIGGPGGPEIELVGPIPRCAVIDSDPSTGRKDLPLLAVLAGYRRGAGEIWFGHYARVVSPGRCDAGEFVERTSRGA
jgi:uncharacterized protein YcbX